jgi:hypothetical protein
MENENLISRLQSAKGLDADVKAFLLQILKAPATSNSDSQLRRFLDEAIQGNNED